MNIRVDLNYPVKDGTEVVFRSPVDCSQVTGLIVYYDGGNASQEFAFADAHGNNVGDIPHLFAENVAVKVILDVTTGMAFVQNADTNAYLEGRFKALAEAIAQMGGSGGTTIHFIDYLPGEIDPSDVNTKYKVGDLLFCTGEYEVGFYELTALDTESDPGLIFPVWELKYLFADDGGTVIVWRGEYDENESYSEGDAVSYNGSSYICTYDDTPTAPDDDGADWELLAEKGYTPVKGTDYWTDADKAEIKAYVDKAILGGAW